MSNSSPGVVKGEYIYIIHICKIFNFIIFFYGIRESVEIRDFCHCVLIYTSEAEHTTSRVSFQCVMP